MSSPGREKGYTLQRKAYEPHLALSGEYGVYWWPREGVQWNVAQEPKYDLRSNICTHSRPHCEDHFLFAICIVKLSRYICSVEFSDVSLSTSD